MPNQSGKILLVLILITVLVAVASFFFLASSGSNKSSEQTLENTRRSENINLNPSPLSSDCRARLDLESIESDVWDNLSDQLKTETYKKGEVAEGKAAYEIYLYKPSLDCKYIAVLLELVGRGAGAYTPEDFLNRQLYIHDLQKKINIPVIKLGEDLSFESEEYGSDQWSFQNEYKFVLTESVKNGEFTKTRYLFDANSGLLKKSVEEW